MMSGLLDREAFRRDHHWAPRRMSDYLDDELAAAGRARLERHLGECAECRRLLAGLRRTLDGLHRLSAPSAGADALQIAASVRARIRELD
jgi:anti-sigma factor RsiW